MEMYWLTALALFYPLGFLSAIIYDHYQERKRVKELMKQFTVPSRSYLDIAYHIRSQIKANSEYRKKMH